MIEKKMTLTMYADSSKIIIHLQTGLEICFILLKELDGPSL